MLVNRGKSLGDGGSTERPDALMTALASQQQSFSVEEERLLTRWFQACLRYDLPDAKYQIKIDRDPEDGFKVIRWTIWRYTQIDGKDIKTEITLKKFWE
jgi:hypothetical protein